MISGERIAVEDTGENFSSVLTDTCAIIHPCTWEQVTDVPAYAHFLCPHADWSHLRGWDQGHAMVCRLWKPIGEPCLLVGESRLMSHLAISPQASCLLTRSLLSFLSSPSFPPASLSFFSIGLGSRSLHGLVLTRLDSCFLCFVSLFFTLIDECSSVFPNPHVACSTRAAPLFEIAKLQTFSQLIAGAQLRSLSFDIIALSRLVARIPTDCRSLRLPSVVSPCH